MAFSLSGFFPGEGPLLFVSVRGSTAGGGTLGDVLAYDSNGTVVASLRTDLGLTSFDPRGLLFIPDLSNPAQTDLLISDASSGRILLFAPPSFTVTPEPSGLVLGTAGLLGLAGAAWRRKRIA
jgi:MYXO-CTERM domain-containing protein